MYIYTTHNIFIRDIYVYVYIFIYLCVHAYVCVRARA